MAAVLDLEQIDKEILNLVQKDFPLVSRPYQAIADSLNTTQDEVLRRMGLLKQAGIIRQTSAIFDTRALGYKSTLVAMKFDPERLDQGAAVISAHSGVSHNYKREHPYNLWFTIAIPHEGNLKRSIDRLHQDAGAVDTIILPTLRLFKIGVAFDMTKEIDTAKGGVILENKKLGDYRDVTEEDKAAVRLLQEDLPLVERPFAQLAAVIGWNEEGLFKWMAGFKERGFFRRFASILRHRNAGFADNAMAVWIAPEAGMEELGRKMASFAAVTHCYQRPTFPSWPYNIFTMIHGRNKEDCERVVEAIRQETALPEYKLLYSTREYKKERVRYFVEKD